MGGHSFYSMHFHLVWGTAGREPFLPGKVRNRLFPYINGITSNVKVKLIEISGMPDHIHLLVGLRPDLTISEFIRVVKANSSKWIHETFPELKDFSWQGGYGAFCVSKSAVPDVVAYIKGQEEHHRTRSFKEELENFLRKHEIEFEEGKLWE
jgi:REP element-mobilizing transposase RayT